MSHLNGQTLKDLGEFHLISNVIIPTLKDITVEKGLGDDVAYVPVPGMPGYLAITCDVGPKPLVWSLGEESLWSWGWYCVACNVSDLASAGAKPIAFTSSVEAPNDLQALSFQNLFEGMAAACKAMSIPNAGGNIRMAPRLAAHGTAIGWVNSKTLLTREGCKNGDTIVVIGKTGDFVTAYLKARYNGFNSLNDNEKDVLIKPKTQLVEMFALHQAGFIRAASDNSDGLLGTFMNLAESSKCSIKLELDNLKIPNSIKNIAKIEKIDPLNILFMWGDWQVVAAIPEELEEKFKIYASEKNISYTIFGKAKKGEPGVYAKIESKTKKMKILRNENFIQDSYNKSIESHLNYMLKTSLF
jgi:thiamine-monophosphate kinase